MSVARPLAIPLLLRRYCAGAVALTATETVPSGFALVVADAVQTLPPTGRCSSLSSPRPRPRPVSVATEPYATALADSGSRASTPTRNHVERSPRIRRASTPFTVASPNVPCAVSVETRPDAFSAVSTSTSLPGTFSSLSSFAAVNGNGPQSWYGEIAS
jgi:hypothetical protein